MEHPDRSDADRAAGECRLGDEDERVERVAVLTERVDDEAIVGRVAHRGEQVAVEHNPAELGVVLILVAGSAWDLDEGDNVGFVGVHRASS
jgi:hypothetical protein